MTQSTHINFPYYTAAELVDFGFTRVGEGCRISKKCSFYAINGVMGDNVRIDDFCIVKGRVDFGSFIHIGAYTLISGVGGCVNFEDCTTLSSGVHVYSASDDYSANALSSTAVPSEFTKTIKAPVTFRSGALVGAHSLILPGALIGFGASIGANCIVYGEIPDGTIISNRDGVGKVTGIRHVESILSQVKKIMKVVS